MRPIVSMALLGIAACGGLAERGELPPEGQLLIHVDTDAWLPSAPGEVAADDAPALFHRLRVEFFAPNEIEPCTDCVREFVLDRRLVREMRSSVGFVPRVGVAGYRARIRLYRYGGAGESRSEPRPESTIESVIALPPVAKEGVVDLALFLATDDVGRPSGSLDAPIEAARGRTRTSRVGTWHADSRRGCSGEPRDGEVCIPGGAFWMGDPSFAVPLPERLVVLDPFFVDLTEVTVGAFRRSKLAVASTTEPDPIPNSRAKHCTYVESARPEDELALNCVSVELAAKYCEQQGGALPTEAQWEFVAGGFRNLPFPWGTGFPDCGDAVFARSDKEDALPAQTRCVSLGAGVARPGAGALDRIRVDGREIVDLAGNVAEWVDDEYSPAPGPCWTSPVINPKCEAASAERLLVRGGAWDQFGGYLLGASVRGTIARPKLGGAQQVGFRCVRKG